MTHLAHSPISLGKLKLKNRVFYAPLAGCSDFPFRKMSAKYNPGLICTEMVKMDALVRYDSHTLHILDYSSDMHPIAAQICGSKPALAGKSARIIEELGFDLVDLNCGCPVDKVTKDGSGSGLLKNPNLIGEILSNMTAAVKIPVTVKIRAGWDHNDICVSEIVKIAEEAGAQAICIHGRTREQGYKGPANWDYIKMGKQVAKNIKVIGNGDVLDGPSAERMFQETGCDAVLVARGTMGQPWIVQEILAYLAGRPLNQKSIEECRQALFEHFLDCKNYYQDHRVCVDMRRVGCWYFKKSLGTKRFRELISRASSLDFIEELIKNFSIGEDGIEEVDSTEMQD